MNIKLVWIIATSLLIYSCGQNIDSKIEYKDWHVSSNRSSLTSTLYPYIEWEDVLELKIGLTEEKAGFDFQYYHHPINAIVFSESPQNESFEIALKLSDDKNEIIDISFLKLDQ